MASEESNSRTRIEHVVVLMLENRSFDHLFGFLDHPSGEFDAERLDPSKHGNRRTLPDGQWVPVSPDASHVLTPDPSHSHGSIAHQIGAGPLPKPMDGFIEAYAAKCEGREMGLPVRRWERCALLGAGMLAVVVTAAVLPWPVPWAAGVGLLLLAVNGVGLMLWRHRRAVPIPLIGAAMLVANLMVAIAGVAGAALHDAAWFVRAAGAIGALAVVGAGVAVWRRARRRAAEKSAGPDRIMACMDEAELPVLAHLAKEFAVCTRWFSSVPGATWPNRQFLHAGHSRGTVDIEVGLYDDDTIFDRLTTAGRSWHVYVDGMAQLLAFRRTWQDEADANWFPIEQFAANVERLPDYAFIEPCHDGDRSNSQHPGNNQRVGEDGTTDFERGERLIRQVYEALARHPDVFEKTVLVITYDEHGGLFDRQSPASMSPPGGSSRARPPLTVRVVRWFVSQPHDGFGFDISGVRVPTVIVSPLIPKGTVDRTVYDHTSIPRTLRELFAPAAPCLSAREKAAKTFTHLFSLEAARGIPPLPEVPTRAIRAVIPAASGTATAESPTDLALQLRLLAAHVEGEVERAGARGGVARDTETPPVRPAMIRSAAPVPGALTADAARGVADRLLEGARSRRAARGGS